MDMKFLSHQYTLSLAFSYETQGPDIPISLSLHRFLSSLILFTLAHTSDLLASAEVSENPRTYRQTGTYDFSYEILKEAKVRIDKSIHPPWTTQLRNRANTRD